MKQFFITVIAGVMAVAGVATASAQKQQPASSCGCQCTCEVCTCPKPEKNDKKVKGKNNIEDRVNPDSKIFQPNYNKEIDSNTVDIAASHPGYDGKYVSLEERYKEAADEVIVAETEQMLLKRIESHEWDYRPVAASDSQDAIYFSIDKNGDGTVEPPVLCISHLSEEPLQLGTYVILQLDYPPIAGEVEEQPNKWLLTIDDVTTTPNFNGTGMHHSKLTHRFEGVKDKFLFYVLAHCDKVWLYLQEKDYAPGAADAGKRCIELTRDQLDDFYYMHQLFVLKGGSFE